MGANWVTVARSGPGATARPSSSTTTAVSRTVRPMPPYSSGMARAGQSRATMEPHSFSGASPVSTTARTTSMGHSFSRNERTEARSSSCSPVNSSSTALPPRPRRLPIPTTFGAEKRRRQIGASVPDVHVSLRGRRDPWCRPMRAGLGPSGSRAAWRRGHGGPLAYTLRCASSSTAEQRTLNPQVSGSNPEGRTNSLVDAFVAHARRRLPINSAWTASGGPRPPVSSRQIPLPASSAYFRPGEAPVVVRRVFSASLSARGLECAG